MNEQQDLGYELGRALRQANDPSASEESRAYAAREVERLRLLRDEQYRVLAKLRDGSYVRYADADLNDRFGWDEAQRIWRELDDARIAGELPLVEFLVVRQADHQLFAGAPKGSPLFFRRTTGRVYKTREHAARAFVRSRDNWEGRAGGWIYKNDRPQMQGYWNLGSWLTNRGLLIPIGDGRYAVAKEAS